MTTWPEQYATELSPRDYRLLERAKNTLLANLVVPSEKTANPLPWHPWRGICPSPTTYFGVWNWDSAFHAIGVAHWDIELAREQIRIFLQAQLPSGGLPDVFYADGRKVEAFGKPPVMPWATAILDRLAPDDAFLREAYDRFIAYERHWRRDRGGDEHGLFHYDSLTTDPAQKLIETKYESGWDDSVRWDAGIYTVWPVDLNSYMVLLYDALAYMAERLGEPAWPWRDRGRELAARINDRLFDARDGVYKDYDFGRGMFSPVLSPACFVPLYARFAPPERAASMARLAADPAKFYPGMPTVSYDNPEYTNFFWRGPTWLNTAYFALKGLRFYGHNVASDCRDTILNWCAANEDHIYEYYDSRTGQGLGAQQFSWSAVFIIEFILNWDMNSAY